MSEAAAQTETSPNTNAAPPIEASEGDEIAAALAAVETAQGGAGAQAETRPQDTAETAPGDGKPEKAAAAAPKEEEKAPEGPAADGWAKVRKKEARLVKEQRAFEESQRQLAARAQQIEQQQKELQQQQAELEADPVAFLSKRGLSFDDLARRYVAGGKAEGAAKPPTDAAAKAAEERIARLEQAIADRERKDAEARAMADYRSGIKAALGAEEFELLRAWPDAESEVEDFADKWARSRNEVLTPHDAAARLQEVLRKQLTTLSSHQVVRSLMTAAGNGGQPKQEVSGQSQVPRGPGASPKQLTNHLAATPAAEAPDLDNLSEDEEILAALRLARGE